MAANAERDDGGGLMDGIVGEIRVMIMAVDNAKTSAGTLARTRRASYDPSATEAQLNGGTSKPWPTELRLHKDRKALTVAFDNGEAFELNAEYLRVRSPSAEVQGHSPDERKTVAGKRNVAILEVHPIGNYAVRLPDDLHSTGIYSWDYFLTRPRSGR